MKENTKSESLFKFGFNQSDNDPVMKEGIGNMIKDHSDRERKPAATSLSDLAHAPLWPLLHQL